MSLMNAPDLDALIQLPKELALEKHFLAYNWQWMKRALFLFFFYFATSLIASIIWKDYLDAGLEFFGLVLTVLFFLARHRILQRSDYVGVLLAFFTVQFAGIAAISHVAILALWALTYVALVHVFHFKRKWVFFILGVALLGLLGRWWIDQSGFLVFYGLGIQLPASVLAIFTTASWSENRIEDFVESWLKRKLGKEHSRMKAELDHAQTIQLSMLPSANPDMAGLEVSSVSIPASEVGGDYYDYFPLEARKLALVIGDVSGHGVASGLVLSGVRSCLYLLKDALPGPAALLGQLNRMLKQTTDKRMFMTMLTAVVDLEENRITYATAGHPLLFHFHKRDRSVDDIKERALPLGAIMNATYPEASLNFESGDYLLFFTDGIFEAADRENSEYGLVRLREKLQQVASKGGSAEVVRNFILDDIRKFIGFQEQLDDMTMVVVRVI